MSQLSECTHLIIDTALAGVGQAWQRHSQHAADAARIYHETRFAHLESISPIVTRCSPNDPFLHWLEADCPHPNWGIGLSSRAMPATLARHFRRWLTITDMTGDEVLFRFYDPGVLPDFLAAFEPQEYARWFGPTDSVRGIDAEGKTWERHRRVDGVITPAGKFPPDFRWRMTEAHYQRLTPLWRRELIAETHTRLLTDAWAWLQHLDHHRIRARVAELIDRWRALTGALPSPEVARHFCLLAMTSCSHLEQREDFRRDLQKLGAEVALQRWLPHAYGELDGDCHDPAWLPERITLSASPTTEPL
ncbi:DUF4123 domain-containing protein [Halomonas coralii]|uniref:DUF4123 domain-containing protein n=1 Tax=Modicisalibacter sp. R2A 31.J TaxID=2831898 RepID=UPI001CCB7CFE|nr:DUF4123 domain-containing protein [Modicisalibacter sp. R2A 31.J]MBZ9560523.1 DUF4123 domain-containing protein [Modicisalibacter sp. R2A 31.J]